MRIKASEYDARRRQQWQMAVWSASPQIVAPERSSEPPRRGKLLVRRVGAGFELVALWPAKVP